jgi:type I site-specific restriction endonuclease
MNPCTNIPLNLPSFDLRTRLVSGEGQIFDPIRRRFVALTPEEWVRQHFINYLVTEKGYPKGLISVEVPLVINRVNHRADIVCFSSEAKPILVVECKAPNVRISGQTLRQVSRYNLLLKAPFLVVTNGLVHYSIRLTARGVEKLGSIPAYKEVMTIDPE